MHISTHSLVTYTYNVSIQFIHMQKSEYIMFSSNEWVKFNQ